jgi:hypothetical protein
MTTGNNGICIVIKKDGMRCKNKAKFEIYCGVHKSLCQSKISDPEISQGDLIPLKEGGFLVGSTLETSVSCMKEQLF